VILQQPCFYWHIFLREFQLFLKNIICNLNWYSWTRLIKCKCRDIYILNEYFLLAMENQSRLWMQETFPVYYWYYINGSKSMIKFIERSQKVRKYRSCASTTTRATKLSIRSVNSLLHAHGRYVIVEYTWLNFCCYHAHLPPDLRSLARKKLGGRENTTPIFSLPAQFHILRRPSCCPWSDGMKCSVFSFLEYLKNL